MQSPRMFVLQGSVKNYEWGKRGWDSQVAHYAEIDYDELEKGEVPYAELWMGTHRSGPSTVPSMGDIDLLDFLNLYPHTMGSRITSSFDATKGLPFLFKVLSVGKALSIQAHPDKETAKRLFATRPDLYPDDNHKPEMAIALAPFEALCGFRPLEEIRGFFASSAHLQAIAGSDAATAFIEAPNQHNLKQLFTAVITKDPPDFERHLRAIVEDVANSRLPCHGMEDAFLNTHHNYPGDIGCLCFFFLNYLKLEPYEAVFIAANEPHAYLSGDCIECMACSDNVVRAGLTPKYRDVQTLCNMLTYISRDCASQKLLPIEYPDDPCCKTYLPPVSEFAVDVMTVPRNTRYDIKPYPSASICLVTIGTGYVRQDFRVSEELSLVICSGSIIFVSGSCNSNTHFYPTGTDPMVIFRAYCKG